MSRIYDLIKDFGIDPDDQETVEITGLSPHWILAVYRLKTPSTYSRALGSSVSTLVDLGVEVVGSPVIIHSDCRRLHTSSTKTNHLTTLSATLAPGQDYLAQIRPGDYVLAWVVNGYKKAKELMKSILAGDPCNRFMDGIKFMGTVASLRRARSIDAASGTQSVNYQLSATGFGPLDAKMFYDPHLAEKIPQLGLYFAKINLALDQLITAKGQGIDVNKAIVGFLDLFLGHGVTKNLGLPDISDAVQSTTGLQAPYGFVIPSPIGNLLNKTVTSQTGNLLAFTDVLEVIYGVQAYSDLEITDDEKTMIAADSSLRQEDFMGGQLFTPDGATGIGSRRYTGTPMMGTFLPTPPQFSNQTVWSIINQYLNPAVNEMYTCLRTNASGNVVPTLVVRQLPFSSSLVQTQVPVTQFLDLPRWKADDRLVNSDDVGRSDSLRVNFVHVYGDSIGEPYTAQLIRNPPVRDDMDIARSGLQSHMTTVSCAPKDTINGPKKWMQVLSDILMGQHLTLTGFVELKGIQAPICPGDNLELNGVVYHIESVEHSCGIDPMGHKQWNTVLNLTHGVSADPAVVQDIGSIDALASDDSLLYALMTPDEDQARYGVTTDSLDDEEQ